MGLKRNLSGEDSFTLIELMIVILILAVLVGIAVAVFVVVRAKANDATARANFRMSETYANTAWFRVVENYGNGYRDNVPPTTPTNLSGTIPRPCRADWFSDIETKSKFWYVTRSGATFRNNGVYKRGRVITGTNGVANYSNWPLIYNNIGISYDYYWDPGARTWRGNATNYAGAYPRTQYQQMMMIVVTPKASGSDTVYWATYSQGVCLGSGQFSEPNGWNNGTGRPP